MSPGSMSRLVATGGNLASTWRLVDVRNDLRDERWRRGKIMITAGVRKEEAGLGGNIRLVAV
jgi:hypothetical protein